MWSKGPSDISVRRARSSCAIDLKVATESVRADDSDFVESWVLVGPLAEHGLWLATELHG